MMVARQALLGRVGEHAAHYAAQGLLGQKVIADLVGHAGERRIWTRTMLARAMHPAPSPQGPRNAALSQSDIRQLNEKWRLLLPGASGPRLTELNPSGL